MFGTGIGNRYFLDLFRQRSGRADSDDQTKRRDEIAAAGSRSIKVFVLDEGYQHDLIGNGVEDVFLIDNAQSIPAEEDKEVNSLGDKLIYYRVGPQGSDASFYLSNGTSGTLVTDPDRGTFIEAKYYYRPVPQPEVVLNPELTQIFDW